MKMSMTYYAAALFQLVHTFLYFQLLDTQLISVTHGRGNFPKVLAVVW